MAQVGEHYQWEVREWNQRVTCAREPLQRQAVLLEVELERFADPQQSPRPVGCTVLDLASGTTLRSGAIGPADAPALVALLNQQQTPVLTWNGEGL